MPAANAGTSEINPDQMNKPLHYFFGAVFFTMPFLSQAKSGNEPSYAVNNINKALLTNASAVVRHYDQDVEIVATNEVTNRTHIVLTILNEKGQHYASAIDFFSSLSKIKKMTAAAYDANGDLLYKVKESDYITRTVSPQPGHYDDNKIRYYDFPKGRFPYTIDVYIEKEEQQTFFLPSWTPQESGDIAVENATFTVVTAPDYQLRYKGFHVADAPVIAGTEQRRYSWKIADIAASPEEPLTPESRLSRPCVLLAPTKFEIDDHSGTMTSWSDFGKFIYELNAQRDILPEAEKKKIHALADKLPDNHEKIRVLYKYMQDNFRYVAIEYGIGGIQTLSADFLCNNRYGDCKALSNYMMAMLKEVSIPANVVVISAGETPRMKMQTDFVSSQFNHAILCVPMAKDTVWLECTSTDLPYNYLSDFTQDRNALMVTPNGGVVVHTPVYGVAVNKVVHRATARINDDGSLDVTMNNHYTGTPAVKVFHATTHVSQHELDQYVSNKFKLPGYQVIKSEYKHAEDAAIMTMDETMDISAANMVSRSDSRLFVDADLVPVGIGVPVATETRQNPFFFPSSFAVEDHFEIDLPANETIEFLPEPVTASYTFGSYSCAVKQSGNKLVVTRTLQQNSGVYEASVYADFEAFVDKVNSGNQIKVVLKHQ
ncbi:DUF3857 domain-containing protein [Taibaiella soli]|uniref:DUF3857 domain-containing protein n=1 Tax=Taibaiella soli TaxID=1649169 RepID=A0A2W2AT50_9BACT|nr:DUF3857 domain-containing protein [Taibaiella soli]PZF70878.1 hypothetical protein DN068_20855 [Taibaiella soli]